MPEAVCELLVGAVLVGAEQGLQSGVGVLDQEPAAGAQGLDHRPQRPFAVRHMHEYEPGVHQVEPLPRRLVRAHVVDADLDRGAGGLGEQ